MNTSSPGSDTKYKIRSTHNPISKSVVCESASDLCHTKYGAGSSIMSIVVYPSRARAGFLKGFRHLSDSSVARCSQDALSLAAGAILVGNRGSQLRHSAVNNLIFLSVPLTTNFCLPFLPTGSNPSVPLWEVVDTCGDRLRKRTEGEVGQTVFTSLHLEEK